MRFVGALFYFFLQIIFAPLAIAGIILVSYKQMLVSKRLGVSGTAIEVLNGRWMMDLFGLRTDEATRKLLPHMPNDSRLGLWLVLFPLYFFYRFTGKNQVFPVIRNQGYERLLDLITQRTFHIDQMLEASIKGVDQFVILGAGYDTRFYHLFKFASVDFFELDQAATQHLKRRTLAQAKIDTSHVQFIEVNFSKDRWFDQLKKNNFDPSKSTLFLLEGVTLYLEPESIRLTIKAIKENSAPGSILVADFYSQSMIDLDYSPWVKKGGGKMLELTNEALRFGLDFHKGHQRNLNQFLAQEGLEMVQSEFMGHKNYPDKGPYAVVVKAST
tara:strand:+ start:280 stop:1263 length:984 start_codon:yes stop_codon:yes gene_type:complete